MRTQESSTLHPATVDDFDRVIGSSEKPVLVDFWAPWCGPCKMMGPVLDEFADEHRERVVVAKVDVDEVPALAQRFGIRSIPTIVFFDRGEEVAHLSGVASKPALEQQLNKVV